MKAFLVLLTAGLAAALPTQGEEKKQDSCGIAVTGFPENGQGITTGSEKGRTSHCANLANTQPFKSELKSAKIEACDGNEKKNVEGILFTGPGCTGTGTWFSNKRPLKNVKPGSTFMSIRMQQLDDEGKSIPDAKDPPAVQPPEGTKGTCKIEHKDTALAGVCKPASECSGTGVPIANSQKKPLKFPCEGDRNQQCCIQNYILDPPKCTVDKKEGLCLTAENCSALGSTSVKGQPDKDGFFPCAGGPDLLCCPCGEDKKQ